ncbi:RNA polymerase sigma factor [Algoriphagus sp. Y33]|uniref:RNA polymerase sigma factor n=1 Tax=Algoriphagus sp. Y33 TaxID=2772483 RepID=UPI00177DA68B|nr:sigma-70 family RNA polymerase sigma factor [Algoriphagus sp. Y33]
MKNFTQLQKKNILLIQQKERKDFEKDESIDEKSTWSEFVEGSNDALVLLYDAYADKLYNYGTQLTRDKELVRDTVQDVFVNLVQKRDKIKQPESVKYYLFACFRRKLFKTLERNKKIAYKEQYDRNDGFQLTVEPDVKSIHTQFTIDTKRILENASKKLPTKQREIIMLHYFEGLTINEVAEILGYSNPESARNLLYKSLKGMSDILREHHDDLFTVGIMTAGNFLVLG